MSTGIGDTLRATREEQGRSLEDAARVLRLRTEQLRALEDERFDSFGGDVYARGFLKSYALELGLDPQPLLDVYRREVAAEDLSASTLVGASPATTPPRRGAPPAWIAWVLVAVVVLAGLGIVGSLGGGRAPQVAGEGQQTQAPPQPAETDPPADADGDDGETQPEPEPEPEPTIDGVELLLALEERSWLRITADGTVVFEGIVEQGQVRRENADEEITVRYGNAGAVRVELNGQDLGVPGGPGQVVEQTYTPDFDPDAVGDV